MAYKSLVKAVDGSTPDPKVRAALDESEPLLFNNMTLVLDAWSPARTATRLYRRLAPRDDRRPTIARPTLLRSNPARAGPYRSPGRADASSGLA
jgi:hypothetical protein